MLPECAEAIRPVWETLTDASQSIFRAVPSIELLHRDLAEAGIPRQDARNRWADFHSFRCTFCTWMAARHSIQVVQRLMRHGTITLTTDIYNDLDLTDMAEELWTLPPLTTTVGTETQNPPFSLPLTLPSRFFTRRAFDVTSGGGGI